MVNITNTQFYGIISNSTHATYIPIYTDSASSTVPRYKERKHQLSFYQTQEL